MAKLTPEEKLKKQKRDNLSVLINGVKSAWSFGSLKTWLDVYNRLGYDDRYIATTFTQEQRLKALTYPELAAYLKTLQDEQERKLNELTRSNETEAGIRKDQSCASKNGSCASKNGSNSNFIEVVVRKDGASDLPSRNGNENETELNNSNDYGLVPSPNEKAFHYCSWNW